MYPQYSKPETAEFIKSAAANGYKIKVFGEYTHDFYGEKSSSILYQSSRGNLIVLLV